MNAVAPAGGPERQRIAERREQAKAMREEVAGKVAPLVDEEETNWLQGKWWFYSTVAEAYFGLKKYGEAVAWLKRGEAESEVPEWEKEATARQLAAIARLQAPVGDFEDTPPWRALREFLGRTAPVRSAFVGKIGLGLSGGGFRASLFHIGVLAKLAEYDVLRRVEVISCVSGGSVIGAHYYLELRNLLQSKRDEEITREDYIRLVQKIERDFVRGVQSNIRTRVAAEIWTNLKTVFKKNYSRTERIGELFEEKLFSLVEDGGQRRDRWLNDLFINPAGDRADFNPKRDNWRREAKVPVLILNAASLNTGHNWQFTASWMGEPAASINTEIDGNRQLRTMRYEDAPEGFRRFRLGRAVAASACVPGLFDPVALDKLYPDMTVRLVDGGTHDNQGVASLLEQDCRVLLVSDASGQMETENNPSAGLLGVPLRALDVLQARVREAQYADLKSRRKSGLLRGLMFIHLKKDLDVEPLDWVGCPDPFEATDDAVPAERRGTLTSYGVRKDVQTRLAAIRTDLDAFTDTEACALMTSGYLMTESEFPRAVEGFAGQGAGRSAWHFLALEGQMKTTAEASVMRMLDAAQSRSLRVWKYSTTLRNVTVAALLLAGALAALLVSYFFYVNFDRGERGFAAFLIFLLAVVVLSFVLIMFVPVLLLLTAILKRRDRGKTWSQVLSGIMLALVGWVPARIQLHVFDPWYLRLGNVKDRPASTEQASPTSTGSTIAQAVAQRVGVAQAAESISTAVDQRNMVDAVGSLFRACGYQVQLFPRDFDINPFQIDLDIYAEREGRRVVAMVRQSDAAATAPNWQTASALETAAWYISSLPPSAQVARGQTAAAPHGEVAAWLFCVGGEPDQSVAPFRERGTVGTSTLTLGDIRRVVEIAEMPNKTGGDSLSDGDRELLRAEAAERLHEEAGELIKGVENFRSELAAPDTSASRRMEV